MKKKKMCLMAVILALALLTACGSSDARQGPEELSSPEELAFAAEYHAFELPSYSITQGCVLNGEMYLLTNWDEPMSRDPGIVTRISPNGTLEEVFSSVSYMNETYGTAAPLSLCAGEDDTFWLLLDCWPDAEDAGSVSHGIFLSQFDSQGDELKRLNVTKALTEAELDDYMYSLPVQVDRDGWTYLYSEGRVCVLDDQQQFRFSLSYNASYSPCSAVLPDGQAVAVVREPKGPGEAPVCEVRVIDKEAQGWGEAYLVGSLCYQLFPGSGKYLFFVNTLNAICGWNGETGVLETLLDRTNSDVDFNNAQLTNFVALEDGRFAIVTWADGAGEVSVLTPADQSELPEKTVLTLACIWCPNQLRQYVTEFNKGSQDYRVEVKEYMGDLTYAEGMQKMVVDITAGNIPDLLYMDGLPVKKFGSKGMLEDLWPYIDSDPELSREDLMSHVLECAEIDGKLYEIFSSFQIKTVAGAADVVGDRLSWTVEDLQAALTTMPEGCSAYGAFESSDYMLSELVNANMDSYVDWETGTCSFESQEFKDLLAYVGSLGLPSGSRSEAVWWTEESVVNKEQMLYYSTYQGLLTSFEDIQVCEGIFGGPVSYVGHPKQDGACGSSFYIDSESVPIAMTASCKDKAAAWSFLRMGLLPEETLPEYVSAFPINRTEFEGLAQHTMEESEERQKSWTWGFTSESGAGISVGYGPFTQTEYDQFMELYHTIDSLYSEDSDVLEAVMSEASVYFAGDITLDEAASRIQKRVQLYMDEQS